MHYTQEGILEAWKNFVIRGVIQEDNVHPSVARSWERCRNLGLDPWSTEFPKCNTSLLQEKRIQYAELLSLAAPVMNYLYALLDCNISICDSDGFVFELITPIKNYPRTLGAYTDEATCGNGAVTIALKEKIPMRTDGYEHYRIISQNHSGVSSPIMINNTLVAVLNGVNPFGSLHDNALSMTITAAKIIEYYLTAGPKSTKPLELKPLIKEMIDDCSCLVVVLEHDGTIHTANQIFASSFTGSDTTGKSLGSYLPNKNDLARLMANNYEQPSEEIEFKADFATHKRETLRCRLLRKQHIRLLNGEVHTLLIFKKQGSAEQKVNHSSPSCSPVSISHKLSKPHEIDYIGESTTWSKVDSIVQKTAKFPSNVLLLGETGTGKEVVAKAIHQRSGRKGNFVAINCGALPKDLLHSELFGYEEGAFTGARAHGSIGKFEHAHEGTLLLDEIGEMPLDMQVTLLRFLQERTITRISSNKPKKVDVRIIAATNTDMAELVRLGQFRQDLYYRLNVIEINLPPLRERKCDIPLLAEHFISELSRQYNVQSKQIHPAALQILCSYDWPGNVRELKNVIEKAMILSEGLEITPEFLPEYILHSQNTTSQSKLFTPQNGESERERIINLLESYNGNIFQAAKALKMSRNTLYRKMEKYNIQLKTSAVKK
ncbi:transcriptional regulator containing PAS, AAA-type ATPase, and DNA-binding domains [Desulfitobacterium dehalogenans ATCC 51507]|uniref:Transcriptional regulator containing PAS, AAA-type ATPase, and DNA-binding domains n=1 Tax=Desulfitobacterium dehalogenans (strain ATCC 51507 / DSM 9161 / JW/IU-DC1) TaxID=756499 RepID=I4A5Y5_DESDJ|nr:sigma 54-interacting transcriptional regulator [Desulfitobacterium dehalogenans]AFL99369.1 transcriptional regulator containing PAS, AAA-type ATPase, and DNA-binding domains [Desulfitobacterium dehalogenans ATCC 51507]